MALKCYNRKWAFLYEKYVINLLEKQDCWYPTTATIDYEEVTQHIFGTTKDLWENSYIAYTIGLVKHFIHKPQIKHTEAATRVVRYLKQTHGKGMLFRKKSLETLGIHGCGLGWRSKW